MDFLAVFGTLLLTWYVLKKALETGTDVREVPVYSAEVSERIDRIYAINRQIRGILDLISDIDSSDGSNIKNITLNWQTVTGVDLTADMLIDGRSEVTEQMRILAEKRLDELTASLFSEIEKLPHVGEKA